MKELVHKILVELGEDLGEQSVKNIADPVRMYKVEPDANRTPALLPRPVSLTSRRWSIPAVMT